MKIKILSWNIWGGKYLDGVVDFLQAAHADIIGLQEVVEEGSGNSAQTIAEKLGYQYVCYGRAMSMSVEGKEVTLGNAVISKYPIVESKRHVLSDEKSRVAVQADIKIGNETLHVFSAHLVHTHQKPSDIQEKQTDTLTSLLPKEKTVLMGDFNALPESSVIRRMNEVLVNTESKASTPTWSVYPEKCCPMKSVQCKLDYIFTTPDLKSESFVVSSSKASDHLPVSVVLEL